jgi:hypothetical protein
MSHYLIVAGFALAIFVLAVLLTRLVRNLRRREMLRRMGLPLHGALTLRQAEALQMFEATEMKFKKSFPHISEAQRRAMTSDVLREKGILPKTRSAVARDPLQR